MGTGAGEEGGLPRLARRRGVQALLAAAASPAPSPAAAAAAAARAPGRCRPAPRRAEAVRAPARPPAGLRALRAPALRASCQAAGSPSESRRPAARGALARSAPGGTAEPRALPTPPLQPPLLSPASAPGGDSLPPSPQGEGGGRSPPRLPLPFLLGLNFFPPAFHWLPEREAGAARREEEGCASPAAPSPAELEPAGVRGEEDAAGGARLSPAPRTAHLPGRSPRSAASPPRALGVARPAGRRWWRPREPAAGQRCRSGCSAASSAEPGRPRPRPVSSPPRARAAPRRLQCRIEVPPRGGQVGGAFAVLAPEARGCLRRHAPTAAAAPKLRAPRSRRPVGWGGMGWGGGTGLRRLVMLLESCSGSWRCVGDGSVSGIRGDDSRRSSSSTSCVCRGGSSWHLA